MNDQNEGDVVLVVDDTPETLSFINDVLESADIKVLLALEGQQALTIANRMRPDMVLLDAIMPRMDGFETCRRFKADPQLAAIPIIFMTGLDDTAHVVQGLEAGGVDYLTKPVQPQELLARMRVHLNNAKLAKSTTQALQSSGQRLLSVSGSGRVHWSTPQAIAAISGLDSPTKSAQDRLEGYLASWLASGHFTERRLEFKEVEPAFAIHYVEQCAFDDHIVKVVSLVAIPEEDILQEHFKLTRREAEVLRWLALGKTNREVGQILDISPRTVNKHLEQVFEKVGVENRTSAASAAIRIIAQKQAD